MKQGRYADFSLWAHRGIARTGKLASCHFELTFSCALHCPYCYTDCYNRPGRGSTRGQLSTAQVKRVLDKLRAAGVVWLCLSGGDPLARPDFLDIYAYARSAGFIVTIFTNGFSMTARIADALAEVKPFSVEVTLNTLDPLQATVLTGVRGSLPRILRGIELLRSRRIPLVLKTQVTSLNVDQLPALRRFARCRGLRLRPDPLLFARLNGDTAPCRLRLPLAKFLAMVKAPVVSNPVRREVRRSLFSCAMLNGNNMYLDPEGRMFLCQCIREPYVNLLSRGVLPGLRSLLAAARSQRFPGEAPCRTCSLYDSCFNCPGRAYLETGSAAGCAEYFCRAAHRQ